MRVLVACEESQRVCISFREKGHEAYSCDIQECSGGHPEWHILAPAERVIYGDYTFYSAGCWKYIHKWDLIIAHPPCTYLTNASAVRMRVNGKIVSERYKKALDAREFFMMFYRADCTKICIENPVPLKLIGLPDYTQIIQPYQFGEPWSKRTCLWLKGLPKLEPTEILEKHQPWVNGGCKDVKGNYIKFQGRNERNPKVRSKTFWGIAKAMADQWG